MATAARRCSALGLQHGAGAILRAAAAFPDLLQARRVPLAQGDAVVIGQLLARLDCALGFDELIAIEDEAQGQQFFSGFAQVINACRTCPKIIVGRVQGKAIGGGVGVAAATDYCFATAQAAVKLSELVVGIGPFVVGPIVERKIGVAAYAQLALDAAEFRPATWAQARGLYAEVLETTAALDAAVQAFAEKLAAYNPAALAALKQVIWEGTAHWDSLLGERAAISGRLVLSDFTRQAIAKFKG